MRIDIRRLYRTLLLLYPRTFRERLGESMQQTFDDLYRERQQDAGRKRWGFVCWMFAETSIAILREHMRTLIYGDSMKAILSNATSAAIISFILALPLGLLYIAFNWDIELFTIPLTSWLTVNGSEVNGLGRVVLISGLFLLPVAFAINLRPMLKKEGPEAKRTLHTANIIVGLIILAILVVSWGGLLVEEFYCLQGIRCD